MATTLVLGCRPTLPCVEDEVNAVASAAPNAELSLDPNPTLVAAKAVPQFDANCGTAQLALLVQALAPSSPTVNVPMVTATVAPHSPSKPTQRISV